MRNGTSGIILLVLIIANMMVFVVHGSVSAKGETLVLSSKRSGNTLMIYVTISGWRVGYISLSFLGVSQKYQMFEDLLWEHGFRIYRIRQFAPNITELYVMVTYILRDGDGKEYVVSRMLGAYSYLRLSDVIPQRILKSVELPLELVTLHVIILARTDKGLQEIGSVDIVEEIKKKGFPLFFHPGYRRHVFSIDCSVEGYSIVQCNVLNGYRNPVAIVYVTGWPSLYFASRLYVNVDAPRASMIIGREINLSVAIVEECNGINITRFIELRPGEPIPLHRVIDSACVLRDMVINAATRLSRDSFSLYKLVNITLAELILKPSIIRVDLVNYTGTGWAEWRVVFNSSRVVEASAGYVEGAAAWWLRGGGPGVVYVSALVWPGYSGGLGLTIVFDDGSVASSYLPPPPPLEAPVNYTVRVARLEPVVLPGVLYYESRIEALEEALRSPGLPYWEQMVMSYELFSRKRALETGEVPGFVAYGLLNGSIAPGDYVTVVLRGVSVSGFGQCYADVYLMMGGDGLYFAEVPVKRIRLANGTYGVSVSLDQLRSWIGLGAEEARLHGVVVHVWSCPTVSIGGLELIVVGGSGGAGSGPEPWLLALAGVIPGSLALAYLVLRVRSRIPSLA